VSVAFLLLVGSFVANRLASTSLGPGDSTTFAGAVIGPSSITYQYRDGGWVTFELTIKAAGPLSPTLTAVSIPPTGLLDPVGVRITGPLKPGESVPTTTPADVVWENNRWLQATPFVATKIPAGGQIGLIVRERFGGCTSFPAAGAQVAVAGVSVNSRLLGLARTQLIPFSPHMVIVLGPKGTPTGCPS
jgi:hypothetical protein